MSLGLYLHIPYCFSKCRYCDFYSHPGERGVPDAYVDALLRELHRFAPNAPLRPDTVYFGGGTPSHVGLAGLSMLLYTLSLSMHLTPEVECTMEANPESLTERMVRDVWALGVNRLSIGVQSFDDGLLKQMDRYEKYDSGEEILERIGEASPYFTSLNVDMIFNFPAQDEDVLISDIEHVDASGTNQTTFYPLMASPSVARSLARTVGKVDYARERRYYEIITELLAGGDNPLFEFGSAWTFNRLSGSSASGPDAMIDEYVVDYEEYPAIGSGGITYLGDNLYVNTFSLNDYNKAILNGIVKIASKMGISTIQSYQSSQIFEAVGISKDVIDKYFAGTVSRVGGIGLEDIQADVEAAHNAAFDPLGLDINMELADGGAHKFRSGKEEHLFTPQTIHLFQKACFTGDYKAFKDFTRTVDNMGAEGMHLRSLLDFSYDPNGGIPLEEVEPVSSIVKRFKAAAMSYGALSSEAHETIAIALNRLGGRSNTGEGGEPEERYQSESNSKIKQVASARFGVTSKYLVSAEEIQIKLAQGAKPGEGGNLPGAKVYPWIAKTRHSTTGVGLISPPPHHDIYSIEDLAELIYDLKNANRHANINVKLVSEAGVGTIAAGVAKGGAQVILVSGYDGGTGAAPRTSIKNAGLPWELGIAETHQTLILNGLRSRVRIESDSKLLSGRDVAISCMLGAEEFGFGTSLLMCEGCVMMRVCNLDTCPMGICTQNPELRKRFKGKPEYIINYLTFVAQELREYMAKLGVRTIDELVGRTDLLHVKPSAAGSRAAKMNLDCILHNPAIANSNVHFVPADTYDFHLENTLDMKVLMKKFKLGSKAPQSVRLEVSNTDRALGAIFGSEITRKYGSSLPDDVYTAECTGAGGQSFGAFIPKGLTLSLTGDCNDYMGKGLSGGKIIVRPPEGIGYKPEENIITGNVALYGATSGKAFVSGVAGERFCVRNSGATAVVEGVGDHGCEYMTGGTVVVLGQTGKNFAAGMTGGVAYVLDENWDFYQRVNKETVSLEPVEHKYDVAALKELIREHVEATGSPRGKEILDNFSEYLPKFKKVLPYDYDRMLRVIASMEERGLDGEQAQIEAFYAVQKKK